MIVGLTGGMGSGKTTVAKMFRKLGVPVYNSDKEAKRLMKSSKKIRKAVKELLGNDAYKGTKLNRKYIADKIFQDRSILQKMNAIVHPVVRKDFRNWSKEQKNAYVVQEAAIIFENGMQEFYDHIILVTAPKEMRIQRILERDGTSKSKILERMNNQWDDHKKIPMADFVIVNEQKEEAQKQVENIHRLLLADAARGQF